MTAQVYVDEKGLFRHFWLTTRFFDVLLRPTKVRLLYSKYLRGFNLPQNILKIWFRDLGHVSEKKNFRLKNHVKWPQFCSTIFSLKVAKTAIFWKKLNRFLCLSCVQILFLGLVVFYKVCLWQKYVHKKFWMPKAKIKDLSEKNFTPPPKS